MDDNVNTENGVQEVKIEASSELNEEQGKQVDICLKQDNICLKQDDVCLRQDDVNDPELNDLLESALEDFDKPPLPITSKQIEPPATCIEANTPVLSQPVTSSAASCGASAATCDSSPNYDAMFNKLFDAGMTSSEMPDERTMEAMMTSLMSGDPALMEQFKQMQASYPDSAEPSQDFGATLQQTLGSLAQNMQDLQNDSVSEDDLMRMMSGLGMEPGPDGSADDFFPMMQGMMKSLLSKDVLYPSLKEISAKYPAWLQENRPKLSASDFAKYERQHQLMTMIITEFDEERATDADDVKRRRFDRVLDIMQQMQELGHPPKEIVGDMPQGMDLDANGLPKFPVPSPEQCCLM